MATRKLLAWVPRLALLVALAGVACRAETGSDVENLSTDCQAKLATLWTNYTTPTSFPEGCDGQCLLECHATLQDAIYADNARDCPHQEDIVRCFHVFSGQWEEYVTECELFAFTGPGDVSLGEGEGEASAGEAAPAPPGEASAGEAAPAPPGEAAPAPPVEAGRRRLAAAEGEGGEGGTGSGAGCFPEFASPLEFERYIDGEYWADHTGQDSNTAGVILSVAFWMGLASMGFFMRH